MDVYFVRHGKTAANAAHRYQPPSELLSDAGSRDVARVSSHLKVLKPTHLLTSHFQRTVQTSEFLSYALELTPERTDYLHELYRPEYLYGRSYFGLRSWLYIFAWFFGFLRVREDSHAETMRAFSDRVLRARAELEQYDEGAVVIAVSHSIFINFFVAHACQDRPLSFLQAVPKLLKILTSTNTGVTHLRYHPADTKTCNWEVVSYDDASHLDTEKAA